MNLLRAFAPITQQDCLRVPIIAGFTHTTRDRKEFSSPKQDTHGPSLEWGGGPWKSLMFGHVASIRSPFLSSFVSSKNHLTTKVIVYAPLCSRRANGLSFDIERLRIVVIGCGIGAPSSGSDAGLGEGGSAANGHGRQYNDGGACTWEQPDRSIRGVACESFG